MRGRGLVVRIGRGWVEVERGRRWMGGSGGDGTACETWRMEGEERGVEGRGEVRSERDGIRRCIFARRWFMHGWTDHVYFIRMVGGGFGGVSVGGREDGGE